MKKSLILSLFFLALTLFSAEIRGRVIGVYDGDTITVIDELDHGRFKIRLDKIDAPEKNQPFGQKAKHYLSSLIFGKDVLIKFKSIDRYGRILGVIFCDGVEINLQMVQSGHAWHYNRYDRTPSYIEAEKKARTEKKCLWTDPDPLPPGKFRILNKKLSPKHCFSR